VVTLDLNMPGLTGFDVLKQVMKIKPNLEVIIITALAAMPNAQKAIRYGASDFLSKPFPVGEVLSTVRKLRIESNNDKAHLPCLSGAAIG